MRFRFRGLDEFKTALRNLPTDLRDDATEIVRRRAYQAKAAIIEAYHEGPHGTLKRRVTSEEEHSPFGISVIIKSRDPIAWLYENGSQARHTALGANRGRMPAQPTFIPIASRSRREMLQDLSEMLERHGLTVIGRAA